MKLVAQKRFLQKKKVKGLVESLLPILIPEMPLKITWRKEVLAPMHGGAQGVLTFDGNSTVKEKVTFFRIKEHLEKVYKRKFSHGTVVQLCVARNRRRASAKRYKGVAKVTSRRAYKGFQLRCNPDSHWSTALYRSLNFLQYRDGRHILNMNQDDAAGYRLDTLTTRKLHRTPVIQGKEILTTCTDYVNNYPSILQTTSYNFTATKTTAEVCVGMVKGAGVFQKNAAQHAADLAKIETESSVNSIFINPLTEKPKEVECIRVDGATDVGPAHLEIQFWWTLRHVQRPTAVTLVTTRSSGASDLNRVEPQNGSLALTHANLFIPVNLNGSCFNPQTGKLDQERLKRNMDQATEIYMSRANGAPCSDTVIHLFKGADSSFNQDLRCNVFVYIKGTKSQKNSLRKSKPDRWTFIEEIWQVRKKHMSQDLPSQYVFLLKCCNASDCGHPLCKEYFDIPPWFPGGPTFDYFPLPIPDPCCELGNTNCSKCGDTKVCYGHFLKPELCLQSTDGTMAKPPSHTLKEAFSELNGRELSDEDIRRLSKSTLLPPDEVVMWIEHLQTIQNNRRSAEKAAATRQQKKANEKHYFCICGEEYTDLTNEVQHWIGCDTCSCWFHCHCVGVQPDSIPDTYLCSKCCLPSEHICSYNSHYTYLNFF